MSVLLLLPVLLTKHRICSAPSTDFVESKSLIVKTEFLQYLKNQVSSEVVSRPDFIDDPCSKRKVVRSLMSHLAGKLHADGEECFIVTAKNPNVLGSDKGKAYFCENFKFCQKAFSRHIDESNLDASTVGKKHVVMSRPNVSFAQHSRPTDGNKSSQTVVPVKVKKVSDNVKVNTKRTNVEDQIKKSPSLLLGKAVLNAFTPVKANVDQPVIPVTPSSNDFDSWWNSDDEFQESENELPDMSAIIVRTPIKLDQDATRSVQSPPKLWSIFQKRKEVCQEQLESPNKKQQNEDNGIRSEVSAGENERATNTRVIAGTSDECKQGTNSNTVEIQSFTCAVKGCFREFPTRWPLLQHYQRHTDKKLIKCSGCDELFKSSTSANKHCQTAHNAIENRKPQYPTRQQLEELERQIMAENTNDRV